MLARIANAFERLNTGFGLLAGLCLLGMTLLVTVGVAARYVLRTPIPWSLEVTEYMLLFSVFMGTGYCLLKEGHIKVEMFVQRLSKRARDILSIVASGFGLGFCGVLLWQTSLLALKAYHFHWVSMTTMAVYLFPLYLLMPIGSSLLCLQYLFILCRQITSVRSAGRET